ncbi:hypothetical protein EX895_004143 [Sporisorium graminicola]|uniref:Uncharacterized protein n=1 Tax=Sporisorium graminicola TaxID=280036 RepID=A0A4U7KQR6_9BASI|nr:hypothetical protein EX895_004143 [Sporisorium graminicola]TKY86855.1 hypothetical protein EX895_004143 [Sporisorium graminicola]
MFFSKGKDEPAEAATSSTAAAPMTTSSSAPAVSPVDDAEWQAKGAAGLGAISSLSPECTPLKHRYDSCFNLWFKDYLAIGDDQIQDQQRQSEASTSGSTASLASTSSSSSSGSKKKSSWFSDSSSSLSNSTSASTLPELDVESRKQSIMERYDRDCAKLFKDYQTCVRKAVTERGLDDLIQQARKENPFPFDHQRQSDPRSNNPPFPFPAAKD